MVDYLLSSNNLILHLLQLSKDREEITFDWLTTQSNLPSEKIKQNLKEELNGIVKINDDSIHIPKKKKMLLVKKAISSGIGLDKIIETLHWREFESFCLLVLEYHDFQTTQNFYFSLNKKRYEIDVIGIKKGLILAIDAKKWKTGHAGALKTMVKNQLNRVKAFSKSLYRKAIRQKLNFKKWRSVKNHKIIPMIVTSKMYEIEIFQRVPIIPFFKLNQFINEYHRYSGMIQHYSVNSYLQKTLFPK